MAGVLGRESLNLQIGELKTYSNTLMPIQKEKKLDLRSQALFRGTSGRIKGNEYKLEYKDFCLNIRKHFTVWVTKH